MSFADLFSLALRGLTRRPARTLLTVAGIVVAVASMVVFLSLGEGIRSALAHELGNIGPDLQITMADSDPNNMGTGVPEVPTGYVGKLKAVSAEFGLKSVYPILVAARGSFTGDGYLIEGFPVDALHVSDIYPSLKLASGRDLGATDVGQVVALAGSKAAQRGKLGLGRDVRFNRENIFKVVGVLKEGGGFTDSIIFVPFDRLATALGTVGKASVIAVKLDDPGGARTVKKLIEARFPELRAQTQGDVLSILDKALSLGDAVRFGISLISLIVGGLAVANTVMMGVYERTREFGVLRAIGAQPVFVFQLVILESILLAVLGGIFGVGLGYLGTIAVNFAVRNLTSVAVAAVTPRLVLLALAIAGALGLLSGLLPARTAGRLQITEALGRN